MKLSHRILLLVTAMVAIAWVIYNMFFRIEEAFEGNTVSIPYFFNTNTITKRKGGAYTVAEFPANATKLNSIEFYTCTKSLGPDTPSSYTKRIDGRTIDSGGSSVQFTSPSFNKNGQKIGSLYMHSNKQRISAMNPDSAIALPCNINQKGQIVGTTKMPGSALRIIGISNSNFNSPEKTSKKGNNVMMVNTYEVI